jgi:hypothetical protein
MGTKTAKPIYPVYIPYGFFTKFINGLRESGLPYQIDRSVMPKASGSAVSGMIGALRFLHLIDGANKPTPLMKELVEAEDKDRPPILKQMLKDSYRFIFDADTDLQRATGQQVADLFRSQDISGSTVSKSIGFFLGAAKEAGIPVSAHVKPPPAPKASIKPRGGKATTGNNSFDDPEETEDVDFDPDAMVRFQIPIPGKPHATVIVPRDLEPEDWTMLTMMLDAYIKRLQAR